MFLLASKTLDLMADPFWWAMALLALGLWWGRFMDRQVRARRAVIAAVAVLFVAGLPGVAHGLMWGLERGVAPAPGPEKTWDVVVLLGGAVDFYGASKDEVAWNGNVERLTVVFDLLRTGRARRVILSGGLGDEALPTEAEYLRRQLVAWGIDPARIELEDASRNTRENATLTKPRIEAHGDRTVLIVTSAFHVPRALGCFRAVGLDPDVWPVDWKQRELGRDLHWAPRGEYFGDTARALREVLGRIVYRVLGYAK